MRWDMCYVLPSTYSHYLLPTTYYPLLTSHYLLPTTYYPLLTTHNSPLTTHHSLLTTHISLRTTHCLLPTTCILNGSALHFLLDTELIAVVLDLYDERVAPSPLQSVAVVWSR